jgi:hypothetical protein
MIKELTQKFRFLEHKESVSFELFVEAVYRNNRCLLCESHVCEAAESLCGEMTSSIKQQLLAHAGTARLLKQVHIICCLV